MAVQSPSQPSPPAFSGVKFRESLTAYLFILPAVAIIALFGLFPIGYSLYMSLYDWIVQQGDFIGFEHYQTILGDLPGTIAFAAGLSLFVVAYLVWDRAFKQLDNGKLIAGAVGALVLIAGGFVTSFGWGRMIEGTTNADFLLGLPITLYYAIFSVPVQLSFGLIIAYLLYQNIKGKEVFRMLYFLPYVTPAVAAAAVFRTIFSPRETSVANQAVGLFGLEPLRWLQDARPITEILFGVQWEGFWAGPSLALMSIVFLGWWMYTGYNAVIFLAGLGSIPRDLYEAAEIDGANQVQVFRYITLPLLSPVTFYLSVIAFIGTFKAFNTIYVMRERSALGTVDTASIVIFDTFRAGRRYGLAAAQAIILFIIILAMTQVQNKIFGEKVFYG
ncbi:MAG: sugar ABC transporter permease [Chloroflexi bacterium]|nr:sugar ABC transporter permease [Chloroflexota bacterium]